MLYEILCISSDTYLPSFYVRKNHYTQISSSNKQPTGSRTSPLDHLTTSCPKVSMISHNRIIAYVQLTQQQKKIARIPPQSHRCTRETETRLAAHVSRPSVNCHPTNHLQQKVRSRHRPPDWKYERLWRRTGPSSPNCAAYRSVRQILA